MAKAFVKRALSSLSRLANRLSSDHVGVAVGRSVLQTCGLSRGTPGPSSHELRPWVEGEDWEDLTVALASVRSGRRSRCVLHIALLPELVEVRRIELPLLRKAQYREVLAREADRFFLTGARDCTADSTVARRDRRSASIIAACADTALLGAIFAAAERAGCLVESVTPAHFAWCAAATRVVGKGRASLLVPYDGTLQLLECSGGKLVRVRRRPVVQDAGNGFDQELTNAGRVVLLDDSPSPEVLQLMADGGSEVRFTRIAGPPLLTAARHARRAGNAISLISEARRCAELGAARTSLRRSVAAVAVLFLAAGVLDLVGLRRELAAIREHRTAIAGAAGAALSQRDSLESAVAFVSRLDELADAYPRWTELFQYLGEDLPPGAYLTSFRGDGDTLRLSVSAENGAGVIQELAALAIVEEVRLTAPITEHQLPDGMVRQLVPILVRYAALPELP